MERWIVLPESQVTESRKAFGLVDLLAGIGVLIFAGAMLFHVEESREQQAQILRALRDLDGREE